MRTTVTLDDALFEEASVAAGTSERSVVLREALQALIERNAARRLARLGGSDPEAARPPRRALRRRFGCAHGAYLNGVVAAEQIITAQQLR